VFELALMDDVPWPKWNYGNIKG